MKSLSAFSGHHGSRHIVITSDQETTVDNKQDQYIKTMLNINMHYMCEHLYFIEVNPLSNTYARD